MSTTPSRPRAAVWCNSQKRQSRERVEDVVRQRRQLVFAEEPVGLSVKRPGMGRIQSGSASTIDAAFGL